MTQFSYSEMEQRLRAFDQDLSLSELQGLMCGLLSGDGRRGEQLLCDELLPDFDAADLLASEQKTWYQRLFRELSGQIEGSESWAFPLWLPNDSASLLSRSKALGNWCNGYLYGLGLTCDQRVLDAECREALQDLGAIAGLQAGDIEENDDNEGDLMQLSEFVRVAASLVYLHLNPRRQG